MADVAFATVAERNRVDVDNRFPRQKHPRRRRAASEAPAQRPAPPAARALPAAETCAIRGADRPRPSGAAGPEGP